MVRRYKTGIGPEKVFYSILPKWCAAKIIKKNRRPIGPENELGRMQIIETDGTAILRKPTTY